MSKTAVVTGGSQGIGKAIALKLAADGVNIVVNYFGQDNAPQGEEVAGACAALGVQSIAVSGDVSKSRDCEALIKAAIDNFGSIDILVNNAGITRDNLVMRMTEEDFKAVLDTNLTGAFLCAKSVTRPMLKQRWGRIINISSVVGVMGNAGQSNYAAAKGGIIAMTKSMAKEFAAKNITVNAIAPGFIVTSMTQVLSDDVKEKMKKAIPMGKLGTAQDVAAAAGFLASDSAAYITGQVLCVDGGMAM